ncbi:MAG: A24 family peptidase [Comamonadaceae bacterium]|nr:A24 family peptidase [Comamonadaceae bacterium]
MAVGGEKLLKKEALGGGDVKLFLFIGFVLTWDTGLLSLFLASFAGFAFGILRERKDAELPFVPFLFAGVLIAHFAGADLIAWYLRLLGA